MTNVQHDSSDAMPPDMRAALDRFSKESEAILDSFLKPLEASEPPPIIYHYTDDVGLRGILETGQFWLSDIFNHNDPSELRHGYSIAVSILKDRAASGPAETKKFAELCENFGKRRPAADVQRGFQFAQDCLRAFHAGSVDVIASDIPYRAE